MKTFEIDQRYGNEMEMGAKCLLKLYNEVASQGSAVLRAEGDKGYISKDYLRFKGYLDAEGSGIQDFIKKEIRNGSEFRIVVPAVNVNEAVQSPINDHHKMWPRCRVILKPEQDQTRIIVEKYSLISRMFGPFSILIGYGRYRDDTLENNIEHFEKMFKLKFDGTQVVIPFSRTYEVIDALLGEPGKKEEQEEDGMMYTFPTGVGFIEFYSKYDNGNMSMELTPPIDDTLEVGLTTAIGSASLFYSDYEAGKYDHELEGLTEKETELKIAELLDKQKEEFDEMLPSRGAKVKISGNPLRVKEIVTNLDPIIKLMDYKVIIK